MTDSDIDIEPLDKSFYSEVIFWIVSAVCGFIVIFTVGAFVFQQYIRESERQISGEVTISNEWLEITAEQPLRLEKQFQSIVLEVTQPLIRDNGRLSWIRLAAGTSVNPQAQIIDQYGNAYDVVLHRMPTPSKYENSIYSFDFTPRLPEDRVYTKLRLRCDRPLHLSRILWHCYNGK